MLPLPGLSMAAASACEQVQKSLHLHDARDCIQLTRNLLLCCSSWPSCSGAASTMPTPILAAAAIMLPLCETPSRLDVC